MRHPSTKLPWTRLLVAESGSAQDVHPPHPRSCLASSPAAFCHPEVLFWAISASFHLSSIRLCLSGNDPLPSARISIHSLAVSMCICQNTLCSKGYSVVHSGCQKDPPSVSQGSAFFVTGVTRERKPDFILHSHPHFLWGDVSLSRLHEESVGSRRSQTWPCHCLRFIICLHLLC